MQHSFSSYKSENVLIFVPRSDVKQSRSKVMKEEKNNSDI